jgi:uncharacterized protein YkwD
MKKLLLLLLLVSCKTPKVDDMNPFESFFDMNIEASSKAIQGQEDYLEMVNSARAEIGLRGLINSPEMEGLAKEYTQKMATEVLPFGHDGLSYRCALIRTAIGPANLCGEIVARGYESATEVFALWMLSDSHRSKILGPRYTHTGVGSFKNEAGVTYWTQIFLEVL